MSEELKELMMDVRDRVIRIETRMETLPALQDQVEDHAREILKAKTSVKMVKWIAGIFLVTIPATIYEITRIFKGT